ncbi:hypothetical protein [Azotobacter beijerinckii]|uniref:hypothetical protein n=1 Tax=Azotobacter beijerinckii TaxID=170623 RepID=UPI001FCDB61D|nr:hypothetical protein [Azotobacter beijerinckii]
MQPTVPSLWQRLTGVRLEEAPAVLWSMLYVIALFLAYFDLLVNAITLFLQLFVTGRLIAWRHGHLALDASSPCARGVAHQDWRDRRRLVGRHGGPALGQGRA